MKEKNAEPGIYEQGNSWQKKVYRKMAEFLEVNPEIKSFGYSVNGNQYKHLLAIEQSRFNFITENIFTATKERFDKHKAGDLNRILTNTAASQPYCFNLFIYLQQHSELADKLFSDLFKKQVKVQHIEPEFTPNFCEVAGFGRIGDETIGDQNLKLGIGTDADVAVFYTYENNKKGILLIEFKFIEAEFSVCSSFKDKKNIRQVCNSAEFYSKMVDQKNISCGYNKYFNWQLTENSKVFDHEKIKVMSACPFHSGLNQLWRNMILAERVALSRNCDEFSFWIFSPKENDDYLWKKGKTEKQFREILTEKGNSHFQKVYLDLILDKLKSIVRENEDEHWLFELERKYRI